ncbi:MAG TPA: helix-turn-helix transcriptional regulator [Sandaracinaceae bacterium LLY-WYZ-13_1]|nr:helix-turn-helix transcriptional regulator [Sandaracinaceae bacterium LLY-WYZ-13_1]
MLTRQQMEMAERLFELDPVDTYPRRGAEQVADLVGASAFRLELDDDVHESAVAPSGPAAVSLPLEGKRETLGTLHLFGGVASEDDRSLARWAARQLARGIRYARRLGDNHQRSYEDVQAMLERTPLTPRERDVVGRLLSGASTRQIAESTGLTVATVNTYLKRIFAKLGVHSRVELVARVTGTRGVIPPGPAKGPRKGEAGSDTSQP